LAAVIEPVVFAEPPEVVGEAEAARISEEVHMGFIERLVNVTVGGGESVEVAEGAAAMPAEAVHVLKLHRDPGETMEALAHGVPLRACRRALEDEGMPWRLPGGAWLFVHPWQHEAARRALNGQVLRTSTVVVSESLEHLVAETLQGALGRSTFARTRSALCVPVHADGIRSDAALAAPSAGAAPEELNRMVFDAGEHWASWTDVVVERTFLCVTDPQPSRGPVAQSTVAGGRAARNPRAAAMP